MKLIGRSSVPVCLWLWLCAPAWAASGDVLAFGTAQSAMLPSTSGTGAILDSIAGADATAAEVIPVLVFDGANAGDKYADFNIYIPGTIYDGGGYTLTIVWASTGTVGNVVWQAAFRAVPDDAEDLDTTDHAYDFNTVTAAAPSAQGETSQDDITFTDGADADSCGDNNYCILRIYRDPDNASDTDADDDAQLILWVLKEQ